MFKFSSLILPLSLVTLLSACGGSGGGGRASLILSGTAAVGAAINNGIVTATCSDGSGFQQMVTTNAQGKWTGTLSNAAALPCALKVSFGDPTQVLHSFTSTLGTINITPLTDLILAKALEQTPAAWFGSANPTSLLTAADLSKAADDFLQALRAKNYTLPTSGSPYSTAFDANGTGWDGLLDELKQAIADYDAFLEGIADGSVTLDDIPEAAAKPDGDGSALAGKNGATATIGSTSYTYTTEADGNPYLFNPLTGRGAFLVTDSNDTLTRWSIGGLAGNKGIFQCDSDNDSAPIIMLSLGGSPHLAQQCVLEVLSVSATEIEGRFSASFDLGDTTNGYFRYKKQIETPTEGLQSGEFGYSMYVDGVLVKNNEVPALDGFDRQVAGYLTLGDTPYFGMRMIPEGVSGSYTCGSGPAFRIIEMDYSPELAGGHGSQNSTHPGTCSISVNYSDKIYSGTFSGTLYNSAGDKIEITNGIFRNDGKNL